jgi:predicted amidohydrolase
MILTLAQIRVQPGNPRENLKRAGEAIAEAAAEGSDVVLLPEALDCGWTHPSAQELAGPVPGGAACATLQGAAESHRIHVCAGLVERLGDRLFNAAVLIGPDGQVVLHHRKLHELDVAQGMYTRGDRLAVAESPWGRLGLMICADAFADDLVITRTLGHMGARIILSPCAWAVPPDRDLIKEPYGQLWRDSYGPVCRQFSLTIAGCSNVGPITSGPWNGWRCIGSSLLVGPDGQPLAQAPAGDDAETLVQVRLQGESPSRG